jgi:hypothetical protein
LYMAITERYRLLKDRPLVLVAGLILITRYREHVEEHADDVAKGNADSGAADYRDGWAQVQDRVGRGREGGSEQASRQARNQTCLHNLSPGFMIGRADPGDARELGSGNA